LDDSEQLVNLVKEMLQNPLLDWGEFVSESSRQLVLPLVYHKLNISKLLYLLPSDLEEYMAQCYELTLERNRIILEQINELKEEFEKSRINHLWIKGAGNLLEGYYENLAERMLGDIDIIIPSDQMEQAVAITQGLGYFDKVSKYKNPDKKTKHYPRLYREGSPAALELHYFPIRLNLLKFFDYKEDITLNKQLPGTSYSYTFPLSQKAHLTFFHLDFVELPFSIFKCYFDTRKPYYRNIYDYYLLSKIKNEEFNPPLYLEKKYRYYTELVNKFKDVQINNTFLTSVNYSKWKAFGFSLGLGMIIFLTYVNTLKLIFKDKTETRYFLKKLQSPDWYSHHFTRTFQFIRRKQQSN
jgi:hypothetical protein